MELATGSTDFELAERGLCEISSSFQYFHVRLISNAQKTLNGDLLKFFRNVFSHCEISKEFKV